MTVAVRYAASQAAARPGAGLAIRLDPRHPHLRRDLRGRGHRPERCGWRGMTACCQPPHDDASVSLRHRDDGRLRQRQDDGRRAPCRAPRRPFRDADEFHPPANVDEDVGGHSAYRRGSLAVARRDRRGDPRRRPAQPVVVSCSALKRAIATASPQRRCARSTFVYLDWTARDARARAWRTGKGHFMPASLLDSQLATLEPPAADERAITVSIERPVEEIVERRSRRDSRQVYGDQALPLGKREPADAGEHQRRAEPGRAASASRRG